jgi:hypothetical protein
MITDDYAEDGTPRGLEFDEDTALGHRAQADYLECQAMHAEEQGWDGTAEAYRHAAQSERLMERLRARS